MGHKGSLHAALRDTRKGWSSALHNNLRDALGDTVGRPATAEDVGTELDGWTVSWKVTEPGEERSLAQRLLDTLDPLPYLHRRGLGPEPSPALEQRIAAFRTTRGYPTARDDRMHREREELATHLTPEQLEDLAAEPGEARSFFNRLAGSAYGSPGNQSVFNRSLQKPDGPERVVAAVEHLLHGPGEVVDRLGELLDRSSDRSVPGLSEALLIKCLSIVDPDRWIPIFSATGPRGKLGVIKLLGLDSPDDGLSKAEMAAATNDLLEGELRPWFPEDAWGIGQFCWRLLQEDEAPPPIAEDRFDAVAKRLFIEPAFLHKVHRLLRDRGQVVFYGPPGTGKTYVGRELAELFAGSEGAVVKVQFHPSYAYEDFVEGYRPRLVDGQASFELVDGPLKQLAAKASEHPDATFVLLVDELNRGNVPKILGELFFLLEYRDEEMQLQYSSEPFSLPPNLWVIATMNTADRSIALVDAALRRRFYFLPFFPSEPPVQGLLRRWLEANRNEMAWVADVVDRANVKLDDQNLAIGPSHFLRGDLDEEWLALVWEYSVLPYLAEQFFGDEDRLLGFALDRLRSPAPTVTPPPVESPGSVDGEPGGESA